MLYGHVVGRLDARQKLDQIVLSVSNKCQLLENAEVTAVRCVMLEDHARFCFFVDCMKPLLVCVTNWLLYGVVTDLISRELDNAVGRARPSVCFYSYLLSHLTSDRDCLCMGYDHSSPGIESQGHGSKSKINAEMCTTEVSAVASCEHWLVDVGFHHDTISSEPAVSSSGSERQWAKSRACEHGKVLVSFWLFLSSSGIGVRRPAQTDQHIFP